MMKDNFSDQSHLYQAYRPTYPDDLFEYLLKRVPGKNRAWDCGTGNGQIAIVLAENFRKVDATDISRQQLQQAPEHPHIEYSIQQAEKTTFPDNSFDLITTGQAIHWFDFNKFYREVKRTIKINGLFAVIGYGLVQTFPKADQIISRFYNEIVGGYWDQEKRYVEEHYQTIPFPFSEIGSPKFSSTFHWDFEHLIGYLNTWSAVKHYRDENEENPVDIIHDELKESWNEKIRSVQFPVFTRIAKIER